MLPRIVFVTAAILAIADALLIMGSNIFGSGGRAIGVSIVVAALLTGGGGLALRTEKHLRRSLQASEGRGGELTDALAALSRCLVLAGGAAALLLLLILAMILRRMSEGYAVFG